MNNHFSDVTKQRIPNGHTETLLRTCGAISSELAEPMGTFGVNYTLTNSASVNFKESSVTLCNSGRCNSGK